MVWTWGWNWPVTDAGLGDRVQLQQVILNLVMNGIEARSRVRDRSRDLLIRSCQHESDKVLVAVQDSGVGLQPESLERNGYGTGESAVRLLRITVGGYGPPRMKARAQHFNSRCPLVAKKKRRDSITAWLRLP